MKEYKSIFAIKKTKKQPPLKDNINTEVLVIGGGIAGILCAHYLQAAGKKVIVVEKSKIGHGVSQNSTACISIVNDTSYQELVKNFGLKKTQQYATIAQMAVANYEKLALTYDFDYKSSPAYVYSFDEAWLKKEEAALNGMGIPFLLSDAPLLPFKAAGAIKIANQGEMNVVKLINELAKSLVVYEGTMVKNIKGQKAICLNGAEISFEQAIVATHFPILNRRGKYFMKMYQNRSFVVALKKADEVDGTYISSKPGELYFRNYNDLLLIGGNDRRTGKTEHQITNIIKRVQCYYPQSEVVAIWGNQDCASLDGLPYIGQYSKRWKHVYVTTGFNMSGMTNAMISAQVLCDLIMKKDNEYANLFLPYRHMKLKPLLQNLGHTLANFVRPTCKRCSHLGCALKWNADEQSFDCPCHGSRFSYDGKILENPSQNKKKPLKKRL